MYGNSGLSKLPPNSTVISDNTDVTQDITNTSYPYALADTI